MTDREKVIKGLECCSEDGCVGCPYERDCEVEDGFRQLSKEALELLMAQKEVVRCKDCKHSVNYSAVFHVRPYKCEKHIWSREADWFCADGERR